MKTYELIKEYPNSPPLGFKISKNLGNVVFNNYPEFWQEIIEKDYEILSFKWIGSSPGEDRFIDKQGKYDLKSKKNPISIENCLENTKFYSILSVKRISDNEIFTIGDTVQLDDTWGYSCKIKEINIYDNEVSFTIQDKISTGTYRIFEKFRKINQPLFTTDDSIDVFGGETLHYIRKDDFKYEEIINISKDATSNQYWWSFSTKEKAEEWVIMNKPCLSIKDIQNHWILADFGVFDKLKELVKSKP